MKKRSTAILMIFIFLNLFISYDVKAISLQEVIEKTDIEKDDKIYKELTDINCEEDILKDQKFYEFLQEKYNTSFENINEVNEEFVKDNLELLNEFINYLNKEDIIDEFINDSFQEEFEFLNREDGKGDDYNSSLEEILEDNSVLHNKDNNSINESESIFQEYIDSNEGYTISHIDDDEYINNEINLDKYKSHINNSDDGVLLVDNLLKDNTIPKSLLSNNDENNISDEEEIDVLNLENKDGNSDSSNVKINISDLEITKSNDEKLKITFKIDNDLDLKVDKNDLKIYIANNANNKEILVTKNKAIDKYLYLENITSISGEVLKLGKNDTLLDGIYTVILSDEEQEKLKGVGLENLIVKVEANFNNKSSSAVGHLKDSESLYNKDTKEEDREDSLLVTASTDNKNSDNKGNDKSKINTESTLPKTGLFTNNFLILFGGFLLILLGIFLLKDKKIEL